MVKERCKKCALCGSAERPLVKSHIIARGFFNNCETKCSLALIDKTGMFKRRRDAIYLNRYTCDMCEKNIFTPLDDYALKIYRDRDSGTILEDQGVQTIEYSSVDRRMLRGYLASLLWRMDLGRIIGVDEMCNVDIGDFFREKIRADLLKIEVASFDYVDVCAVSLRSEMSQSISVPRRMILTDGVISANGFMVQLPYLCMFVSLDNQIHPYVNRDYPNWLQATPFSLNDKYRDKSYSVFRAYHIDWQRENLIDAVIDYNNSSNRQGPFFTFS